MSGQALSRSRGGSTSRIHVRTNCEGLPLGFVIMPGAAHDATDYDELLDLDEMPSKERFECLSLAQSGH